MAEDVSADAWPADGRNSDPVLEGDGFVPSRRRQHDVSLFRCLYLYPRRAAVRRRWRG